MQTFWLKPWKVITSPNLSGEIKIYSQHKPLPIIDWYELSDKQQAYATDLWGGLIDLEQSSYFTSKGEVFLLDDYMRVENHAPDWMKQFDGYHGDSFFSGTLIKFVESDDYPGDQTVILYTYIS